MWPPDNRARADKCIFCGCSDIREEHIFGRKWVAKTFGLKKGDKLPHRQTRGASDGGETFDFWWKKREADLVAHCVCDRCNSGWMNALDNRVQPLISPFVADGTPVKISGIRAVHELAAWFTKLAILFDYRQEIASLPPEVTQGFYRTRTPPPRTRVWLVQSEPEIPLQLAGFTWAIGSADFYLCVVRVQSLAGFVSFPLREHIPSHFLGESAGVAHIWPLTGKAITLPLTRELSSIDFIKLCDEFQYRHVRAVKTFG